MVTGKMPAPQGIFGYFFNWKSLTELHKKDELLVLLAGKMPAPQKFLGIFLLEVSKILILSNILLS